MWLLSLWFFRITGKIGLVFERKKLKRRRP